MVRELLLFTDPFELSLYFATILLFLFCKLDALGDTPFADSEACRVEMILSAMLTVPEEWGSLDLIFESSWEFK